MRQRSRDGASSSTIRMRFAGAWVSGALFSMLLFFGWAMSGTGAIRRPTTSLRRRRSSSKFFVQAVPDADQRLDVASGIAELFSEMPNMHVDRSERAGVVVSPHRRHEGLAAKCLVL